MIPGKKARTRQELDKSRERSADPRKGKKARARHEQRKVI